jgi:hypothetical protein
LTDKQKALLYRAILGLILVEIPVIMVQLQQPQFNYPALLYGLLGAAAGYLEKYATIDLDPKADPPRT